MKKYFYSDGNEQFGPFDFEELKEKKISRENLVWCEGMGDWQKAGDVEELKFLFATIPPPIKKVVPPPVIKPVEENPSTFKGTKKTKTKRKRKILIIICSAIIVITGATLLYYYLNIINQQKRQQERNEKIDSDLIKEQKRQHESNRRVDSIAKTLINKTPSTNTSPTSSTTTQITLSDGTYIASNFKAIVSTINGKKVFKFIVKWNNPGEPDFGNTQVYHEISNTPINNTIKVQMNDKTFDYEVLTIQLISANSFKVISGSYNWVSDFPYSLNAIYIRQ